MRDFESLEKELVVRWGSAASEVLIDSKCDVFREPHIEGIVGYRIELGCAVTYGDPICPKENTFSLAQVFHKHFKNQDNVIYLIASERFAKWAINNICSIMLQVGEELILNPQVNPLLRPTSHKLRNKVKHAKNIGLTVNEYIEDNTELENSISQVGEEWHRARHGPQIYLSKLDLFGNRTGKRWFYVKDKEKVIAMALLSRLEMRKGWLLKYCIHIPSVTRGTPELLVCSILDFLRDEGCTFLTIGVIPADTLGDAKGLSKLSKFFAVKVFKIAKWLFHLNQRKNFWEKFHPEVEKIYVLFDKPRLGLKEIKVLMRALKIDL